MTRLERWLARLYFIGASSLFVLAAYQVNLSTEIIVKKDRMMPVHLQRAFEAGCKTKSKRGCPSEAAQFRKEQDSIYN